jgi:Glycosyl hydrolase-like 10
MGTDFANPENRPKQKRTEDRTSQTSTGSQSALKLTPVKIVQKHTPPAERQKTLDELAQRVTDWRKPTRVSELAEPAVKQLRAVENEIPNSSGSKSGQDVTEESERYLTQKQAALEHLARDPVAVHYRKPGARRLTKREAEQMRKEANWTQDVPQLSSLATSCFTPESHELSEGAAENAETQAHTQTKEAINFGSKGKGTLIASNVMPQLGLDERQNYVSDKLNTTAEKGPELVAQTSKTTDKKDSSTLKLRNHIINAVFFDASGNSLAGQKGKDELSTRLTGTQLGTPSNAFIPFLTTDGRTGIGDGYDREGKYPSTEPISVLGMNLPISHTYQRDVMDEAKAALESRQWKVGKNKNDFHVVPWVESAFTAYIPRLNSADKYMPDPQTKDLKLGGFAASNRDAILTTARLNPKTGKTEQVPIEFMNEFNGGVYNGQPGKQGTNTGAAYLDPLNAEVQKNVKENILRAASKDYIPAIMIDDHFGIPLDKPDVRAAILERHPVDPAYLKKLKDQGLKDSEIQNMWLRDKFTEFVKDVKKSLKEKNVELWASTNLPENAKQSQGQNIEQWINDGLVDNWNVQLYRANMSDFTRDYDKLQAQAKNIPQVAQNKVPLSVSLTAKVSTANGIQPLSADLMSQQASYIENNGNNENNIETKVAAFGDRDWAARMQEQN